MPGLALVEHEDGEHPSEPRDQGRGADETGDPGSQPEVVRPASSPSFPSTHEHVHASLNSVAGSVTPGTVESDKHTSSSRSDSTGHPSADVLASGSTSSSGAPAPLDSSPFATGREMYRATVGSKRRPARGPRMSRLLVCSDRSFVVLREVERAGLEPATPSLQILLRRGLRGSVAVGVEEPSRSLPVAWSESVALCRRDLTRI